MPNLGLTNLYLKAGLALLLFGLVCGGVVFIATPEDMGTRQLLVWGAMGGLISGFVLYVIGRIVHAARHLRRA